MRSIRDSRFAIRRFPAAFTLVELMAVIAIIGLMMLVAMPSIQGIKGSALISAARQFSNDLTLARQYAISHNCGVRVVIATDRTIRDSGTAIPALVTMQFRAYAIMYQSRVTSTLYGNLAGDNQPLVPIGMVPWQYAQDWKYLPAGVIFDPAQANLQSNDGRNTQLSMTTIFGNPSPVTGTSSYATQTQWDKISLDKLPFPYRNGDTDPPKGSEMAFIEFKPNGTPTMAGSVRLINGIVSLNSAASGGGATVIVPGRPSPTAPNGNTDPAASNCVVLSWDDFIGKIKWTQPGK